MTPLELSNYNPGWPERFETERERLLSTLGFMTEGGIIFSTLEHVGSTAVPGLIARPYIDIAIDTETPLSEETVAKLAALGYEQLGDASKETHIFTTSKANAAKLYFVNSSASQLWSQMLVWRDYLQAHANARQRYNALKRSLANQNLGRYEKGKADFLAEAVLAALKWHVATTGFKPLKRVQTELSGLEIPWMVSSGWALDLFLGEPTRYHDDLDISIWYDGDLTLQNYLSGRGWQLHRMLEDGYSAWKKGERIEPPHSQVHARRGGAFIDCLFSRQESGKWIYRRDETVTLPLGRVFRTHQGIPYLAPEAVLLYKSSTRGVGPRSKDAADFGRVLPHLSSEAKQWLKEAVTKGNSDHPWLAQLH